MYTPKNEIYALPSDSPLAGHQLHGQSIQSATRDPAGTALQLYTIGQTCAFLNVSRWQVYQLINSRDLGSVKIRRRRLIPAAALADYLASLRSEAPS